MWSSERRLSLFSAALYRMAEWLVGVLVRWCERERRGICRSADRESTHRRGSVDCFPHEKAGFLTAAGGGGVDRRIENHG